MTNTDETTERCARCGRVLARGEVTYLAQICLTAEWRGRVADTGQEDVAEYVRALGPKVQGIPSELMEEEIHREIEGRLCMRCKEHFAANPFAAPARSPQEEVQW